ncbi:MAG: hypothetical protein ACP5MD_05850, partial [Verrucomicrobiia bacterium]
MACAAATGQNDGNAKARKLSGQKHPWQKNLGRKYVCRKNRASNKLLFATAPNIQPTLPVRRGSCTAGLAVPSEPES